MSPPKNKEKETSAETRMRVIQTMKQKHEESPTKSTTKRAKNQTQQPGLNSSMQQQYPTEEDFALANKRDVGNFISQASQQSNWREKSPTLKKPAMGLNLQASTGHHQAASASPRKKTTKKK